MGITYGDGKYHAQVMDVALGESKNGNPQIVIKAKIISGLQLDSEGNEQAISVSAQYDRTIYLTVTDKSKEMVLAKLRWAGWVGDKFETIAHDLMGKGVRATCKIEKSQSSNEKYAGQDSEKWDLELPPLESKPLENHPAVAKKLNALFGKMLKDKPTGELSATPAAAALPAHGEPPPADEVPF